MKEKLQPKVSPLHGSLRELFRGAIHYPILRNETRDPFGGLLKMQEGIRQGTGAVVIFTHFSEVDPVWMMNGVTEKIGMRNIPILQPIASDRTYGGAIIKLSGAVGIDLSPIVTPDAKERALHAGKLVTQGDGLETYMEKAAKTLQEGGIVSTPYFATRQPHLSESGPGVTTKLLYEMQNRGVQDFNIHFAAPEILGVKDYREKRKFNLFTKHIINHGETYSIQEFLELCGGESIPGETERRKKYRALKNVEKTAYEAFKKIVPTGYMPRP